MTVAANGIAFEIPGYRIVRELGQGGMATVYLAQQTALGRSVAIKVLAAERTPSEDLVRRFEQETRLIARLDHPHVVSVYEVGRTSTGQLYYTMPYLPNGDLASRRPHDQGRILEILRALLQALSYAHEQGIVHRDVKPENVLFDKLDRPLLADFGIALSTHENLRVTREGATLGSAGYMSPEQARGQPLDGRSDLYSLGVMIYEFLAGDMPFLGPDALAVALAHVENPVPRLPPQWRHWQDLIDRALAKNPAERFQDAGQFIAALDVVDARIKGDAAGLPPPAAEPAARIARGLGRLSAGAWVGLAAIGGAALLLALLLRQELGGPAATTTTPVAATVPAAATTTAPAAVAANTDAAPKPEAGAPILDVAEVDRLLRDGGTFLKAGKLVEPAGANAAERYLAVLGPYPGHPEAVVGLGGVLKALGAQVEVAYRASDADTLRATYEQAKLVADQGHLRDSAAWKDLIERLRALADKGLAQAQRELDSSGLPALDALTDVLSAENPELRRQFKDAAAMLADLPAAGAVLRDSGGPDLVFIPARLDETRRIDHAFALGRYEITRREYAEFAKATGRADARCHVPKQPFSRLKTHTWRDPDFVQTADDPVVCVSWQDAMAYARWIGTRTGARYRLPTQAEWLHVARGVAGGDICKQGNVDDTGSAGRFSLGKHHPCKDGFATTAPVGHYAASAQNAYDLAGNVSEWNLDCSTAVAADKQLEANACPERVFRGLSWRDGPDDTNLAHRGEEPVDLGYTTIGFRLLREVALDKMPPAAAR